MIVLLIGFLFGNPNQFLFGNPNQLYFPPQENRPGFALPAPRDLGDSVETYPNPYGGTTVINPDETRMMCFPTPVGGWKCLMD